MARADQQTGRRRAARSKRRIPLPPLPPAPPRGLLVTCWFALTLAGLVLCLGPWTPLDPPGHWATAGAVTVSTTYACGLAARTGGRPVVSGGLALVLAVVAAVSREPVLLSGVAVGTAALAAVLGVMATKPAARFGGVVREVCVAAVVAAGGAFAVEAYQAPVSVTRAGYLALGLALLGAVCLVYRLGAGFTGLGRRGVVAVVSGIVLLFVGLAYTEALSRWGSGELNNSVGDVTTAVRDALGAVPRPTEFLLGFPALAWGVSTRARRRQGWWVSAFGAAGLSVVATSLLDPEVSLVEAGLVLAYSLVLGLVIGYAVIRADAFLTGTRGRRARRLEEQAAHRPEPSRTAALL